MAATELLREAFRRALELPMSAPVDSLTYRGVAQWDSVAHMLLVTEIETTFDIALTMDQVIDMNSFLKAREIVSSHGVEFDA